MIHIFLRVCKYAIQNFFRNFWLSMATLVVIVILLFFINIVIAMNQVKSSLLMAVDQKIDISLFFKQGVPEAEVLTIEDELNARESVSRVELITPDAGLEQLKARYPNVAEKILPALDSNPLGYTLKIRAKRLEDYQALLSELESNTEYMAKLDTINLFDSKAFTSQASELSRKVNFAALILAGIFFFVALLIMFNSIRVSIYTHREEISIMKLVGATNWFIRTPFIIESVLYSLISVLSTIGILYFGLGFLQPYLDRFFGDLLKVDLIGYYSDQFLIIFGMQFIVITFLAVASTTIALRRYLRV